MQGSSIGQGKRMYDLYDMVSVPVRSIQSQIGYVSTPRHYGSGKFLSMIISVSRVVSAPGRFGPGSFRPLIFTVPGRFGPVLFRSRVISATSIGTGSFRFRFVSTLAISVPGRSNRVITFRVRFSLMLCLCQVPCQGTYGPRYLSSQCL